MGSAPEPTSTPTLFVPIKPGAPSTPAPAAAPAPVSTPTLFVPSDIPAPAVQATGETVDLIPPPEPEPTPLLRLPHPKCAADAHGFFLGDGEFHSTKHIAIPAKRRSRVSRISANQPICARARSNEPRPDTDRGSGSRPGSGTYSKHRALLWAHAHASPLLHHDRACCDASCANAAQTFRAGARSPDGQPVANQLLGGPSYRATRSQHGDSDRLGLFQP